MKSSERQISPQSAVEELLELMTDERFTRHIEASLEQTAMAFESPPCQVVSAADLLECVAHFTQVAVATVLSGQAIPEFEAQEQALEILDRHYVSGPATGHEAAILAVIELGEDALPDIIEALKVGMKTHFQSRHMRWAYSRLVSSRPWRERCAIAAACRDRLRHLLPDALLDLAPHRLEPVLLDVLTAYVGCTSTLFQVVSG
ncbi:MAG: hypothetical protein HN742_26480 [Lentisphaerae bacterium]|jgi:hypothetical protein|nr:hypothetical protein [Lentisphaerota bacterium]MBT4820256.1 hypothetical protein [Lentisphaerota bacterium]MBT5606010.1 hypothetical protein [Lentisphaerota bacterium]MBT7058601.1 hypothetical protein [Lentisphaerota bacterium]MBT7845449.1 hypothetical protein [Lentisphaerota bacterium]